MQGEPPPAETPEPPAAEPETAEEPPAAEATPEEPAEPEPAPDATEEPEDAAKVLKAFKATRRIRAKLEKERERLEAQRAELDKYNAEREELEALRKRDPYGYLRRAGIDVRELLQRAANPEAEPEPEPTAAPGSEDIAALRKELEELRAERQQEVQRRQQEEGRRAVLAQVASAYDPAAYPFLGTYDAREVHERALDHMIDHYQRTKQEPSIAAVLGAMEAQLAANYERLSKARAQVAPQDAPRQPAAPAEPGLSNRSVSSRATSAAPADDQERKRRAAAIAREALANLGT